MNTRYNYGG